MDIKTLVVCFVINCFVSKVIRADSRAPVGSWTFTSTNGGKDLSQYGENNFYLRDLEYADGPNGESNGAITLPFWRTDRMIVFNHTDKLSFDTEMTYFTYINLKRNTHGALFHYNTGTQINRVPGSSLIVTWSKGLKFWGMGFDFTARKVLKMGEWTKVAVVWKPDSISIYSDGVLVKQRNMKKPKVDLSKTRTSINNIHMGFVPANMIETLDGKVACVKFFNVALTGDEVQGLGCD